MSPDDEDTSTPLERPTAPAVDHFPLEEFTCHDGTPYPAEWVSTRLAKLKGALEKIRARWAATSVRSAAIIVVCGYRTPAYNARIARKSSGVAKDSQHPEGTAADVRPVNVADVPEFYAMIDAMVRGGELDEVGGYGPYPQWVHVDVRDKPADGHVARWVGAGFGTGQ